MKRILLATNESYPWVETRDIGRDTVRGIGDPPCGLAEALLELGYDVVVVVPGYPDLIRMIGTVNNRISISGEGIDVGTEAWSTTIPGSRLIIWVITRPELSKRSKTPSENNNELDWENNPRRVSSFCRSVVKLLSDEAWSEQVPDLVHCNNWQTGLIPALLSSEKESLPSVFTIRDLPFQGFFEQISFLKAGIAFSDRITTVNSNLLNESFAPEGGRDEEGLLQYHEDKSLGISNGVDYNVWNPQKDIHIAFPYDADTLDIKTKNKLDLQYRMNFELSKSTLLVGVVSRYGLRNDIDLFLFSIRELINEKIQWIVLCSREDFCEGGLKALVDEFPERISVIVDYDDSMSHKIVASVDLLVMQPRYEPCNLNPMHAMRYGTLSLLSNGERFLSKADSSKNIGDKGVSSDDIMQSLVAALALYKVKSAWREAQLHAMKQDFSWERVASEYAKLYDEIYQLQNGWKKC